MSPDDLQRLTTNTADEIAPGLVAKGLTLIVIVAGEEGWAMSIRGEQGGRAEVVLGAAARDAAIVDGWLDSKPVPVA